LLTNHYIGDARFVNKLVIRDFLRRDIVKGQIVFITDGSLSARLAGLTAIELARLWRTPLRAVFILDESWSCILGDEWISASGTRTKFFRWLENELVNNAQKELARFQKLAEESGVEVETEIATGQTTRVILELAGSPRTALLVLPNPHATRPAAEAGLKFNFNTLAKKIKCPVIVGPNTRP
jgi:nucleotide-binding universal stress UspA family protein